MSDQTLQAVAAFALVTTEFTRLVEFYRGVLGFAVDGTDRPIDRGELAHLGLSGSGRRQVLNLGSQTLWIEQFEPAALPYPADSDAASLSFQHLALVVDDMQTAYSRLRDVTPISREGPQHLPVSSGGVQAFKFRDPDGHPLELLQFPRGRMPSVWRDRRRLGAQIGLGIDHSAICVEDVDASAAFYRALGLDIGEPMLNAGLAQQRLDGLMNVEVAVLPMKPPGRTPHLELLGYRIPRRKSVSPALRPNDVVATRVIWRGAQAQLIGDPDGHLHQVQT